MTLYAFLLKLVAWQFYCGVSFIDKGANSSTTTSVEAKFLTLAVVSGIPRIMSESVTIEAPFTSRGKVCSIMCQPAIDAVDCDGRVFRKNERPGNKSFDLLFKVVIAGDDDNLFCAGVFKYFTHH